MERNLNKIELGNHDGTPYARSIATSKRKASVSVYFDNLQEQLVYHINQADVVLGCVAWLTNKQILEALASIDAQILVQKEDFLRPDIDSDDNWKMELQWMYERLSGIYRHELPGVGSQLSYAGDVTTEGVRCVGIHGKQDAPQARMHHKFLVFCKQKPAPVYAIEPIVPYAVWTGSFNFTENSVNSLENAVYIKDKLIADAYAAEYGHVLGLSEPLDWQSEWVSPEYRIGT